MEHERLISIAQKVIHKFGKDRQFEGAQYNSEARAKCAVYSRVRTKQGRGVIKEIRYFIIDNTSKFILKLIMLLSN